MVNKMINKKRENKRGQFYFMATIIIIGLVIGLAVIFNYSAKSNSYAVEEIAKELSIEGEKVLDYDSFHSPNEFENFAKNYSAYVGEDKQIYFIIVEGAIEEAYRYSGDTKFDLSSDLAVVGDEIQFSLEDYDYSFPLEDGQNFYFLLVWNEKGEKYVLSG